jgi:hypothetical protein
MFDMGSGSLSITDGRYWQRPEVIESIFYLWRATKEARWRDMGWRMWRAIEQHCKWEGGYSGAQDADQVAGAAAPCQRPPPITSTLDARPSGPLRPLAPPPSWPLLPNQR